MIEDILIYGAVQGSVYALLALGYSLVYGVGGVLNLAHGSYYLIAAYKYFERYYFSVCFFEVNIVIFVNAYQESIYRFF